MKKLMNKNTFLGLVIGFSFFSSLYIVMAEILINSEIVYYKNTNIEDNTVTGALDDLLDSVNDLNIVSLNGGEPVIKGNLIPVTIEDDGRVKKANPSWRWYDYEQKEWANAIELFNNVTDNYNVGDTIPEENIRSYFVWIPKYKYKLWNVNKDGNSTGALKGVHSIEIEFDTVNTTDISGVSCATPMTSNASGNCDNGEWMTHPAFISMGVNGFWVGKFEIGHKNNNTTVTKTEMNPESDAANIAVKPDYYSWTNTSAANYFNTMLNYNSELQSHMMKNTEWGAVAYLSHSKYGKDSEININNYMNDTTNYYIKTGYSANPNTDQHTYPGTIGVDNNTLWNTENGYLASTTGNITGIYDMVGGSHEYMASFLTGVTDITSADTKYYDIYGQSSNNHDFKYRILGDATGEMGPFKVYQEGNSVSYYHNWYGDNSFFIQDSIPWFGRGGYSMTGSLSGIFYFTNHTCAATNAGMGSRLVLAPTK